MRADNLVYATRPPSASRRQGDGSTLYNPSFRQRVIRQCILGRLGIDRQLIPLMPQFLISFAEGAPQALNTGGIANGVPAQALPCILVKYSAST